ncbi:MAG: DMT family transporter [Steroidobacteraceae bacterium]
MQSDSARGVFAMFIAVAAFSFMDALLKVFAAHYPPFQVSTLRAAASLPFVIVPLLYSGRLAEFKPNRIGLHLLRGLLGVVMLATFVAALRAAPLASVYSVYMGAPLLIAALAAWWLGERVDAGRWIAIAVGLGGVLIILQPRGDGLSGWAGLLATLSALCYALAAITARVLTRTERSATMVFSFLVVVTVFSGLLAAPDWIAIRPSDWGLIALTGALGAAGQHYITEAFRHAPASVVAPIEYTALLWGLGIDWVVWAVFPNTTMLGGATLVIAAGLYVAWRERRSPA